MSKSNCNLPIGLFDSGLGGLTVLDKLRSWLPGESYIYLGDTARYPYGTKSPATLIRYARECARFLRCMPVKLVVIACNSASAIALNTLEEELDIPVVGAIMPVVRQAVKEDASRIGVIGTQATIGSNVYQRLLNKEVRPGFIKAVACPLFVPLVEAGMLEGDIVSAVIQHHLRGLKEVGIDTLILGCTHYPLLKKEILNYLNNEVKVIESAEAIAYEVERILGSMRMKSDAVSGTVAYYVTDEVSRFNFLAERFFEHGKVSASLIDLTDPVQTLSVVPSKAVGGIK
ncbi:MAG: glutamate racemase [Candidatus Dadabacteria bacterium]|nr:MAG: glutamate racemase [Candidatus Dadabacteria bacterium]